MKYKWHTKYSLVLILVQFFFHLNHNVCFLKVPASCSTTKRKVRPFSLPFLPRALRQLRKALGMIFSFHSTSEFGDSTKCSCFVRRLVHYISIYILFSYVLIYRISDKTLEVQWFTQFLTVKS